MTTKVCACGRRMNFYAGSCRWCRHPTYQLSLNEAIQRCTRRQGECLIWTAGTTNAGYALMTIAGVRICVHRAVWEATNGKLPDRMGVLHSCDIPPCVELKHLFIGTQADNIRDMVSKGRHAIGSRNGQAKLDESTVVELRELYASGVKLQALARKFGVDEGTILPAVRGRTWRLAGGPLTLVRRRHWTGHS
jgi:hypothetical protein